MIVGFKKKVMVTFDIIYVQRSSLQNRNITMKGFAKKEMFIPYVHNIHKAIHYFGCESGHLLLPMKYGF